MELLGMKAVWEKSDAQVSDFISPLSLSLSLSLFLSVFLPANSSLAALGATSRSSQSQIREEEEEEKKNKIPEEHCSFQLPSDTRETFNICLFRECRESNTRSYFFARTLRSLKIGRQAAATYAVIK